MKKENQLNENCSECNCVENATKGLDYFLSRDRTYYCISSLGSATDDNIIIPNCYNNLPVTKILDNAFRDCKNIRSVVIPDSVIFIDLTAFLGCSNLTNIVIDKNNNVYDSRNNCNAIIETSTNTLIQGCSTTIIPDTVASIGCDAFNGCRNLTNIEIPDSVENIDENAFEDCTGLTSIVIPNSVENIGENAFFDCSSLISIEIPNSVKSIGDCAFVDCSSLTSIDIPDSVESIGFDAFEYCGSLTRIVVDENNKVYDSRNNCNALIETATNTLLRGCNITVIPNTITSIENYAFSGCSCLATIDIPNSVRKIGESAFYDCSSLTNIVIPKSVKSIGECAFNGCDSLTRIVVDGKNKVYDSRNNCNAIIETATNTLIQGCNTTIIPNTVTSIKNNAFESCSSLTSIVIPNSITFIGYNIFKDCSSLKTVFYEGSVTNWNNVDKRYLGIENKYVAFYSKTKPADNDYRYWHYVDNVPTLWNEK